MIYLKSHVKKGVFGVHGLFFFVVTLCFKLHFKAASFILIWSLLNWIEFNMLSEIYVCDVSLAVCDI